ncbi:MAG: UDP-N-acetylmuramate--L-alanine ligase [Eggerthellaceae bacterium]|nr:UDP-N-acetylmuramate--L-alanine ligase [Eggerthellaceae bacterium]
MSENSIQSVHFIGIGGVGMSGIARVAHDQGMRVTGSDMKESRYTKQLVEAGVQVFIGEHKPENIPGTGAEDGPDVVVVTTAVLENNPELIAARERGLTIWHRAQMLARLGVGLDTVAVAGTHGKTTTSSMVASAMDAMGLDPTFLIGGIVRSYGTNAHSGTGRHYVVEADESDKSFRYLSPAAALITNIEADHLDHYRDLDEIREKFAAFISMVPADGPVVICGEDESLVAVTESTGHAYKTYGFGEGFDIQIVKYEPHGVGSDFAVKLPNGEVVESCVPQNPGRHNVLNAAGAIGLIDALGFSAAEAAQAMRSFGGVKRRFDLVGEAAGVTVIDDYAHHPTEIAATIQAASKLDYSHVHVLFQPHRYSRAPLFCEVLHDEFGAAFDAADTVTFMDVYSAGEAPVPGVTGKTFLQVVLDHEGHPPTHYVPRRIDVVPHMAELAGEGDLVITMGAGDVTAIGGQLVGALQEQAR